MTASALSEFQQLVQSVMNTAGCSYDRAAAAVRASRPDLVPAETHAILSHGNVLEREEQAFIAKLFKGFGCCVYNLSQARASKQTPGLPDLWVVNRELGLAWWFETKRQVGGKLSDAQRAFRDECAIAGVRFAWGDRHVAARLLLDLNIARTGDGPCGIVPFHQPR